MRRLLLALLLVCPTCTMWGQSALTTITGTLVGPGGSNPSGTMVISWQRSQNNANPRQTIPAGRTSPITITNGIIPNVQLFPNTTMLPAGTCYSISYNLSGLNSQRYWTVPVSSTPVDIGLVEGNIPCANQPGPTIALGNLANSGASVGQVPVWNGNFWSPGNGGGGGGGNPGGNNGDLQFNNIGAFGGFTVGGDCLLNRPNFICTKTNGVLFAPSATIDTTNAANITVGVLPPAHGGTGAGQFSQGSIPFVGVSGVYQQANQSLFFDPALFTLKVASTGGAGGYLAVDNVAGGNQAAVSLRNAGVEKFQLVKTAANNFSIYDDANLRDEFRIVSGDTFLSPVGGHAIVGGTSGSTFSLDVQGSGSAGTSRVFDQTATTGNTIFEIVAGASQVAGAEMFRVRNSTANIVAGIDSIGAIYTQEASTGKFKSSMTAANGANGNGLNQSSDYRDCWNSTDNIHTGSDDVCLARNSAGVLEINNGTFGTFRDLVVRNLDLTASQFVGGGTVNLCADNSGNVTTAGCPGGGGGGGTVTNTGALNAGQITVGTGGNNITALGTNGTTTQSLHGNPSGNPFFAATSLTADVTGVLPLANGGTGLSSNFTNHFFFGNNSGGTAAPIATQPTWADLAAGSALTRATFPGGDLFIGGVNTQSGTSYTILTTDENKLVTFNNGSATAVGIPVATTSGFTAGAEFHVYNIGAGAVTITPTTSTINGSSTAVLNQGQGAVIVSDGANYSAWISAAPSGSGTVTSIATTAPLGGGTITSTGTLTCTTCVTSAAALTLNNLILGGGGQASAALGSLGTIHQALHGNAAGPPAFAATDLTADVTGVLPTANIALALANQTSIHGLGITASTGTLTIANGKTLTASNTLTFTGTDGSSVAFGTGGTATFTSNNLSVFAATTSAQLAGVLSDETGTGLAMFNTDPSLAGPILTNEAEGTCNSGNRGKMTLVTGGTGVADTLRICVQRSDNTFGWTPLI